MLTRCPVYPRSRPYTRRGSFMVENPQATVSTRTIQFCADPLGRPGLCFKRSGPTDREWQILREAPVSCILGTPARHRVISCSWYAPPFVRGGLVLPFALSRICCGLASTASLSTGLTILVAILQLVWEHHRSSPVSPAAAKSLDRCYSVSLSVTNRDFSLGRGLLRVMRVVQSPFMR
jgi:hypothetical protein